LSHSPGMVITAVAGPTLTAPAPAAVVTLGAVAARGGAGGAAGFAACPQATAVKSKKHNQ